MLPPFLAEVIPPGPPAPLALLVRAGMTDPPARHDLGYGEAIGLGVRLGQAVGVAGFEAVPFSEDIKAADLSVRSWEGGLCGRGIQVMLESKR